MGILADMTTEERLVQALKFPKVATTNDGYLTDISVAMLMVEMKRWGIRVSYSNGERT